MITPNMNLDLPTVGPSGTLGPEWADLLNAALTLVDSHDHSEGNGKRITPAGININQELSMNQFRLSTIGSMSLFNNPSAIAGAGLIYEAGGELYFNDGSGNQVQLTSGGAINVASLGTITGDYSTSDADLTYSDASKTFIFKQNATVTANVDCGPIKIYKNAASSVYARIQQNAAQASNLDWFLPPSYPASTLPVKSSNSGVMSIGEIVTADVADSAITHPKIANENIITTKIADGNVTTAKIADGNVTTIKIADSNITTAKIADGNVTSAKLAPINLAGVGSGSFFTSSTSFVDVTGMTTSFTATNRPVRVSIYPGYFTLVPGNIPGLVVSAAANVERFVVFRILRGAAIVQEFLYDTVLPTGGNDFVIPMTVSFIDTPAPGTYQYKVQMRVGPGASATLNYHNLWIEEL